MLVAFALTLLALAHTPSTAANIQPFTAPLAPVSDINVALTSISCDEEHIDGFVDAPRVISSPTAQTSTQGTLPSRRALRHAHLRSAITIRNIKGIYIDPFERNRSVTLAICGQTLTKQCGLCEL